MQTLALSNYGISELSFDEQRETDGGFLPAVWGIMVAIDLGLMAIYATYDAAGKLNHGGDTPKPHGEHR
jgi:hypothetical protein